MGKVKDLLGSEIIQATDEAIRSIEIDMQEKRRDEKKERMQLTRRQAKVFLDKISDDVADGWINPLDAFIVLTDLKKQLESAAKSINELAIEESQKYGNTFEYQGYTVTNVNGRKTFDFSACDEIVDLEKHLKERKEFYKKAKIAADSGGWSEVETLPDGTTRQIFQDSNNELLTAPIIKYSKSYITIK